MANWYTSDLHLGHANVIRFCERPFASVGDMDAHYLKMLESNVTKHDDLWILGDIALGPRREIERTLRRLFERVPGRKHFVLGNHDSRWITRLGWHSVHQIAEIRDGAHKLVLCHFPMRDWHRRHSGALHLFGHVHDTHFGYRDAVNVGVDVWNHQPVQIADILKRVKDLPVAPD